MQHPRYPHGLTAALIYLASRRGKSKATSG